jgi:hypothetical protein
LHGRQRPWVLATTACRPCNHTPFQKNGTDPIVIVCLQSS